MATSVESEVIAAISVLVSAHLAIYDEKVLRPALAEIDRHLDLGDKARNTPGCDLSNEEADNLELIVGMDNLLIRRLAADGPQEASFCPHPLYLFKWHTPTSMAADRILKQYVSSYADLISSPILSQIGDVESKLNRWFSAVSPPGQYHIEKWSAGIRAVNRANRFFERRVRATREYQVFFQDV